MPIPSKISDLTTKIRKAIYGKDVREDIAEAIEQTGSMLGDTQLAQDILNAKYDEQLKDSDQLSEVNDAHVSGNDGAVYDNIGKRFDHVETDLASSQRFKLTTDNGLSIRIPEGTTLITSITTIGEYYIPKDDSTIITDHPSPGLAGWKLKVDTSYDGTMYIYTLIKNTTIEDRFQEFIRVVRPGTTTDTGWRLMRSDAEKYRWFMDDALKDLYNKVADLQNTHTTSIGFITDTHYVKDSSGYYGMKGRQTLYNLSRFSEYGLLDLTVHGGDMVDGEFDNYKDELAEAFQAFNTVNGVKCILKGNHDYGGNLNHQSDNPHISNELTAQQWYNRMIKPFNTHFVYDSANPTGGYFYRDFDDVKLRAIFLNTADIPGTSDANGVPTYDKLMTHGIRNTQLNWLINKALTFSGKDDPDNWSVITFSHVPLADDADDYNHDCINGIIAHRIIKTFTNHTAYSPDTETGDFGFTVATDFTGGTGRHICHISGHVHRDSNFVYDDVQYMTMLLGATADISTGRTKDTRPRTLNTILEDSWSVLTVDTSARKLYVSRFGQGDNLTISF
jgi:hypothetical protein